uniref:Transcription initiation factor TFIID subunit 12 n=1 Tax=Phallusia mammillata TaxID=59560 RepID=A0A6F9DUG9_9ASCI|nr:transcription initiation factor TFIID subunit 12-like [Phallusia mammillata]
MEMSVSAHTVSLQQTLKGVDAKLSFLGPGPHDAQQAEELKKLTNLKQKLVQQIQASIQGVPQQQSLSTPSPTTQLQQPTTQLMTTTITQPSLPPKPVQQMVLTKPRPAVPQFLTPSVPENDGKILNKQRLHELVKEVDPTEQLDEDAEEMLMQITDDFIENVVAASCELARHRKSNTLEAKDIKLHLEKHWNITVPGYSSDEIRTVKKSVTTDAHKQRLALIRKATKK